MPSYFPPTKNAEYIFYLGLVDSSNRPDFKSSPTIAAGDFQVSIDGAALANLTTLPVVTPASSVMVKFTLAASEMNSDNTTIVGIDAAGVEWDDVVINIHTGADSYQAKIVLIDDDNSTRDLYLVTFYINGEPTTTGITSPTIQVFKASDGTDLVTSIALTEIASLGMYRHSESTNRILDGDGYVARAQATIDSATRVWNQPVGRDS